MLVDSNQLHLAPGGVDLVFDRDTDPQLAHPAGEGSGLIILTGITAGPVWLSVAQGTGDGDGAEQVGKNVRTSS